jgi:hypothetical protein
LFDAAGREVGTHGTGPSWTLGDGGKVMGVLPPVKKLTVRADAVPWLEISAKAGTAAGSLKAVTVIQRLNTTGGEPPADALKGENVGKEFRVPYTAEYRFYAGP